MQNILVIIIFSIACFYLGKKLFETFRGDSHDCDGCAASQMQAKQLKKGRG